MADPPIRRPTPTRSCAPARGLDIDGLLGLLERLDGAEESAVVRGALEAGVPAAWCWRSSSTRSSAG